VLLAVCALALVGLVGAIVRQSYVMNSNAVDLTDQEEAGATALHPMLSLLGALVNLQSAAVRGSSTVDAEAGLNNALGQIAGADPTYQLDEQTKQSAADLTAQIRAVQAKKLTGRPAYDAYSGLVTLAGNLMRHTADTSHLIHDPEVDTYFVMDAAVNRLPDSIANAGRAADLVGLNDGHAMTSSDELSAAVARSNVANSAAQVSAGLNQSVDFTSNSALGSNVADRLDAFMAAAASFAPPNLLTQSATVADPGALAADAGKVYATALSLDHYLITQLQNLLADRESSLNGEWRFTASAAGVAGLIALFMAWLLAAARPRGSHARTAGAGESAADRVDGLSMAHLTDAQQLFDQEELINVGRAVRPRARGRGDAL
jgi:hypothetical protein